MVCPEKIFLRYFPTLALSKSGDQVETYQSPLSPLICKLPFTKTYYTPLTGKCNRLYQEIFQSLTSGGMAQFPQCLGFNLANTFTCYVKFFAYFFQCACSSILQSEAQTHNLTFSFRQRLQRSAKFLSQHGKSC